MSDFRRLDKLKIKMRGGPGEEYWEKKRAADKLALQIAVFTVLTFLLGLIFGFGIGVRVERSYYGGYEVHNGKVVRNETGH